MLVLYCKYCQYITKNDHSSLFNNNITIIKGLEIKNNIHNVILIRISAEN